MKGFEHLRNNVGLNRFKIPFVKVIFGFFFGVMVMECQKFTSDQDFWLNHYGHQDISEHYMAIFDKNSGSTKQEHANYKINRELRERGKLDFLSQVTLSKSLTEISPELAYHSFMIASYKFPDQLKQNSYLILETGDDADNNPNAGQQNPNDIIRGLFDDDAG